MSILPNRHLAAAMGIDLKRLRQIHNLGPTTREWVVAAERAVRSGVKQARFTGYTDAGPGFRFVRHNPEFAMILTTERGEGQVWVDGEWVPCRPGFAYLTAPGAPHAHHIRPRGQRWRLHWAIYHDESLPSLERGASPRLEQVEATAFRHAVEGLCHEDKTRGDGAVMGLWTALVDRSTLRLLEADQADARLDRLWLAIREDIGGDWSLQRMARYVGLSPESLRRLCQQHLKRSPMAQCTRLRMQAAADHLRYTEEKLEAIAARFGYSDAFAFSTAFRRVWGLPPSRYRRS